MSLTSVGRGHISAGKTHPQGRAAKCRHPAGQEWVSPTQSLLWVLEDEGRVHVAVASWLPGVS